MISDYAGITAPPTLYDRSLFDELTDPSTDEGGKRVVRAHGPEAAVLHWPASALADIDLPDNYARVAGSNLERLR